MYNPTRNIEVMEVEEIEKTLVCLITSNCSFVALAKKHYELIQDAKECRNRIIMRLQLQDGTFKTSDKKHPYYNMYDAYCQQIRSLDKHGKTVTRDFSIESELKRLNTLCEKHPDLKDAIKKAFCI